MEEALKTLSIKAELKWLVIAVIFLALLDVLTGVINAAMEHNYDSSDFKKGCMGKIYELLIIAISSGLDHIFQLPISVVQIACIFYIVQETSSILENTGKFIPYPQVIKDLLRRLHEFYEEKKGE